MKTEKIEPSGYTRYTTEGGYTVTVESQGHSSGRVPRVVLNAPDVDYDVLAFYHPNAFGAGQELAHALDRAYHAGRQSAEAQS